MKVSNRDKILLIILAVVAACSLYYLFILSPMEKALISLNTEVDQKTAEKGEIDLRLSTETNLDKRIKELEGFVSVAVEPYYGALTQEEVLMTAFELGKGLELRLNDIQMADMQEKESPVLKYIANVSFIGDYPALYTYLENIKKYNKKIVIRDILIQNRVDEELTGKIALEFNGFPLVQEYDKSYKSLVTQQFTARSSGVSLFSPYEGFEMTSSEFMDTTTDSYDYTYDEQYETVDYETYRPKTQIYGFEDGTNFFVGSSPDITGYVSRTKTKIAGGYSTEVNFDFVTGREFSEASVVFDTNPVMLNKQAEYLGLWVYSYAASNHAIGAVIIDAKGREYRVELAPSVSWTQWQELEVMMPVEISYPCMIQRIYIEGIGYEQKLTGKYLLDKLQVSYPVQ